MTTGGERSIASVRLARADAIAALVEEAARTFVTGDADDDMAVAVVRVPLPLPLPLPLPGGPRT